MLAAIVKTKPQRRYIEDRTLYSTNARTVMTTRVSELINPSRELAAPDWTAEAMAAAFKSAFQAVEGNNR